MGHRHGLGGIGDRLHTWLAGSIGGRLRGERRAVLLGVVLGDEQRLGERLRNDFRASGLYHLLRWWEPDVAERPLAGAMT